VLRWTRPDLTATLAELALEAAADAEAWIVAAGWLLHGRAAIGDGRETASELLDGLARWGEAGLEHMTGHSALRLRVELAGPARQIGEPSVARTLLSAGREAADADPELRADLYTELARCAVDDAPDTADDALHDAEQAWEAAGCAAGVASVTLLRAALHRRAGRADLAIVHAQDGLNRVDADGRGPGATASDHVAAALTAEWIAALVEAGRVDEARSTALPAADRLVATARPSRQVAGLRLAIARVIAVGADPDAVIGALEPAAQDAADSDVPELESACRSMLGELHEAAGRLDAALGAVRTAMAADRRDRDRGARLRTSLAPAAGSWAARSGTGPARGRAVPTGWSVDGAGPAAAGRVVLTAHDDAVPDPAVRDGGPVGSGAEAPRWSAARFDPVAIGGREPEPGAGESPLELDGRPRPGLGSGRRARRLAAEATGDLSGTEALGGHHGDQRGRGDGRGHHGDRHRQAPHRSGRRPGDELSETSRFAPHADAANGAEVPAAADGGSLIGDALARELAVDARPGDRPPVTAGWDTAVVSRPDDAPHTAAARHDPRFGDTVAGRGQPADAQMPDDADPWRAPSELHTPGDDVGPEASALRWNGASTWDDRPSSIGDTVVLGVAVGDHPAGRPDGLPDHHVNGSSDGRHRGRHSPAGGARRSDGPGSHERDDDLHRPQHAGPADTVRYDGLRDDAARYGGAPEGGPVREGAAGDGAGRGGPDGHAQANGLPGHDGTDPAGTDGGRHDSTADRRRSGPGTPGVSQTGRRPARPGAATGPGRPPSADTDGLGLADLLAGALAAYRNM
jgi:hypothetical protein